MQQYRDAKHEFSRTLDNGVTLDVWCRSFGPVSIYYLLCGNVLLSELNAASQQTEAFFKCEASGYEGEEGKQKLIQSVQDKIANAQHALDEQARYLEQLNVTAALLKG